MSDSLSLKASLVENIVKKNCSHLSIAVFFDHLDLHSLNDYNLFIYFGLRTQILGIWGLLIYHWKGLANTFPTMYYMPPKSLKVES